MARSSLGDTTQDINTDSGAVLMSLIMGEQVEFPITLDFLSDIGLGYTYEAVVVEAANVAGQTEKPTSLQPSGVQSTLTVRVPTNRGIWDPLQAYNTGEITRYGDIWYSKDREATEAVVDSTPPISSPKWIPTDPNTVYVQFPSTLAGTWAIQPAVAYNVYGFFELRVTEPAGVSFRRTWKPIRGMVQMLFSPTQLVPDV